LIIQAIVPLGILINYYQALRLRMVPAERILDLLDSEEKMVSLPDARPLQELRGEIEFRDVHFAYNPDKPVLQGVSFKIRPGSRVAFVGPSGIGKSTIMNLFLRFYDPEKGKVFIDGVNLAEVSLAEYRQMVGIVLQEPVIFDGTIRDNVLYGSKGATEEDFRRAVKVAELDEFVDEFPDGYDTWLQGGGNLALGQKQRISVARCIARKPSIVLLDEPTSLVDPASKQSIVDAIDRVAKGRTAIFISHDLLTLKDLDEIIVLNEGVVAEQGTHEELLELKGLYSDLWQMQIYRSLDN
jgi:ABC-type multidrug transport system fused ATPase/permease subunit